MNIEKGSMLYRLALYGVLFNERNIQTNLCPFMRLVFVGIFLIAMYSYFGALLIMVLLTPIVETFHYFYNGWMFEWNIAMKLGVAIWTIIGAVCAGSMYFSELIEKHRQLIYTELEKNSFVSICITWIISMHQKFCPQLDFTGTIRDGYLKKIK